MERSYEIQTGCMTNGRYYEYDDLDANVANRKGPGTERRESWPVQPHQPHQK